jgi:hypothetical protein
MMHAVATVMAYGLPPFRTERTYLRYLAALPVISERWRMYHVSVPNQAFLARWARNGKIKILSAIF